MYQTCIQLESNLASVGDKDGLANARKLFESALATYSQDVSLWQEYYTMESEVTLQFLYNLEMYMTFNCFFYLVLSHWSSSWLQNHAILHYIIHDRYFLALIQYKRPVCIIPTIVSVSLERLSFFILC